MRKSSAALTLVITTVFPFFGLHAQAGDPPKPTETDKVIPEKLCPPGQHAGDLICPLSDALQKTDGVIVPRAMLESW